MLQKLHFPADLVTFTKEIFKRKLHFLRRASDVKDEKLLFVDMKYFKLHQEGPWSVLCILTIVLVFPLLLSAFTAFLLNRYCLDYSLHLLLSAICISYSFLLL